MKLKDPLIKIARLMPHVALANEMRPLIESPAFEAFFGDRRARLIEMMIAADTDDARRDAAYQIGALDALKQHLTDCVARGVRARTEIERLDRMEKPDAH